MNTITILLSTYNGIEFIEEQIKSILNQKNVLFNILVRDDNSYDGTVTILNHYAEIGKISFYRGPNLGPARSFLDLIKNAPESDYYAFCDQDDLWLPNKLDKALSFLVEERERAALYYSSIQPVDENLNLIGKLIEVKNNLSIIDSLSSYYVTGCTIVFNSKLRDLILKYKPLYIFMHDEWIYKVCVTTGGRIFYDKDSYILYRQHTNNVVGANVGNLLSKSIKQFKKSFLFSHNERSKVCFELYNGYKEYMDVKTISIVKAFAFYRQAPWIDRMKLVFSNKIVASSIKKTILLKLAILIGKF